jgi:propionyl-CoA carboxylase beta chain
MALEGNLEKKLAQLEEMKQRSRLGGGERRIQQQHDRGKLTARERLTIFFDNGVFEEMDPFMTHRATEFGLEDQRVLGDAVVTAHGHVEGRQVFAFAQDFTVMGGSLSEVVGLKICKLMDFAIKVGSPVVGLIDSGGARIQEGVDSLRGYGDIFLKNTLASGVIPQISVILGPAAGGGVYSPALTDFIFMVEGQGQMYITGPEVVKSVTGEEVTHEQLGGVEAHTSKSGMVHFSAPNEQECIAQVRRLLSFLPSNNTEDPPKGDILEDSGMEIPELRSVIPEDSAQPYDMKRIIGMVVDSGDFLEVHERFAPNIIVGFARMNGSTVGIVAQQPLVLAGVLDIDASVKSARFVRFCDAFNIPLVTLVDVPGYLPGTDQEYRGIIRHGAKLIYAYAEATVPKVSVLTRKAYGGAYIVMSSKHLRGDLNYAWPTAEVAVMGPDGAVNIVFRDALQKSDSPEKTRAELTDEYRNRFANPYVAASRGYLDDVIDPATTRTRIIRALEMLRDKRDDLPPKKHGNIPL